MKDSARYELNSQQISKLHSSFQPMVRAFLDETERQGFKLRITHGLRTHEEQDRLYAQGRPSGGPIVTNARGGESVHNFGLAIDVYDEVARYNPDWKQLENIAKDLGIEHGDRGHTDLPHFQYIGGLYLSQLQRGNRPKLLDRYKTISKEAMEQEIREYIDRELDNRLSPLERALEGVIVKTDKNTKRGRKALLKASRALLRIRNTRRDLKKRRNKK